MNWNGRIRFWRKRRGVDLFYGPVYSRLSAVFFSLRALIFRLWRPTRSFRDAGRAWGRLLQAGRLGPLTRKLNEWLVASIRNDLARRPGIAAEAAPFTGVELTGSVLEASSIVLKPPRLTGRAVVERGVLYLKYNEYFDAFRRAADMETVLRHYRLVLEPSWSSYENPAILAFAQYREHPIVVTGTCEQDLEFLERLQTNLRPAFIGNGDWVHPEVFHPTGAQKVFDAIMVAKWTILKRLHLMLQAMQAIQKRGGVDPIRLAVVAPKTNDVDEAGLRDLINRSGVADYISIFEDIPPKQMNELYNQARVNVVLSRQEGGNRSLFEGFLADTPGLAMANHIGIPKRHFNSQTGALIQESGLADALLHFRENGGKYSPRSWALQHIAPEKTTAKLNALLRQTAEEMGEPWTRDIVGKCNMPDPTYYPDASIGSGMVSGEDILAGRMIRKAQVSLPEAGAVRLASISGIASRSDCAMTNSGGSPAWRQNQEPLVRKRGPISSAKPS